MDYFKLIVKGLGAYFLVLGIIELPALLVGVINLLLLIRMLPSIVSDLLQDNVMVQMSQTLLAANMTQSLSATFRAVIYLFVARNFLRSQSLVNWFSGRTQSDCATQPVIPD